MDNFVDKVNSQVQSFYAHRPNITHSDQVEYEITDDVFSRRLELVKTERDKRLTLEQKDFLQSVNGNFVWGKRNTDNITVLIAKKTFQYEGFTWCGTVHHEYTHAHDFWNLADHLNITEMDDLYDYAFYTPFEWWSEYHARKAGTTNVYRYEYARDTLQQTIYVCNQSLYLIADGLKRAPSVYEAMQWFGRYSALKEKYRDLMPALCTAHKKYGLSDAMIAVGDFLHTHQEFCLIHDKLDEFKALVDEVQKA